jgi:hypothetical protein
VVVRALVEAIEAQQLFLFASDTGRDLKTNSLVWPIFIAYFLPNMSSAGLREGCVSTKLSHCSTHCGIRSRKIFRPSYTTAREP